MLWRLRFAGDVSFQLCERRCEQVEVVEAQSALTGHEGASVLPAPEALNLASSSRRLWMPIFWNTDFR